MPSGSDSILSVTTKSCMSSLSVCGSGSCWMSLVELQQYRFKQSRKLKRKKSSGMDQRPEAERLGPFGGSPAIGDRPGFDLSV